MPNASQRDPLFAIPAEEKYKLYKAPGVMYAENDLPGSASHLYQPPESAMRAHKGDLGMEHIANFEPRATDGAGNKLQAKNLRGK
ncbi:MAG TPA: hypothetical protein VLV86_03440 [Vicinamibacterales bacterium]|nr:hypothetical protein [Vicinamibacterales bacterium]